MAAQNPGTFENWITDRIIFGNSRSLRLVGSYDSWITDRIYYDTYPDKPATFGVPTVTVTAAVVTPSLLGIGPKPEEGLPILEDDEDWLIAYVSSRILP